MERGSARQRFGATFVAPDKGGKPASMISVRRPSLLAAGLALALTACGSSGTPVPGGTGTLLTVLPVLEATGWATNLSTIDSLALQAGRPSAMLGVLTADYLQTGSLNLIRSALAGVTAQERLNDLNEPKANGSGMTIYDLLAEMQTAVNVDVADMLNRSTDRAATLDQYVLQLTAIINKGARVNEDLTAETASLTEKRKTLQSDISDLSKQQKEATKNNQFQLAGDLQLKLDESQRILDETDRQLQVNKETQKNLGNIGGTAVARRAAIEANREILIAGLTVVDLPQTPYLGILKAGSSSKYSSQGGFRPF